MKTFEEYLTEKTQKHNYILPNEDKLNKWFNGLPTPLQTYIKNKKMTAIDLAEFYIVIAMDNGVTMKDAFDYIYHEGAFEEYKNAIKGKI